MKWKSIVKTLYDKYEDEKFELLKSGGKIVVKDKIKKKYFEINEISDFNNIDWKPYCPKFNTNILWGYLCLMIIFLIINMVFFFGVNIEYKTSSHSFLFFSLLYTLLQVIVHESAHIFCMKICGRKIDKVGIKFNYIFPCIYVRMNDIYMLTTSEKILVHSAGIMSNLFINGLILIISFACNINILFAVSKFFVIGLLMNISPILNSDGYKVLIGILNINEKKNKKQNNILISVLGYVNITVSILYSIKLIVSYFIY